MLFAILSLVAGLAAGMFYPAFGVIVAIGLAAIGIVWELGAILGAIREHMKEHHLSENNNK